MNDEDVLRALRTVGFVVLEPFAPLQFAEAWVYLMSRPVFADCHVPQTARNQGRGMVHRSEAAASECVCVHNDDAVLTPNILERALGLTDIAAAYLGRDPPRCYSANAFWTRPGAAPLRDDIQAFHKDGDDIRFLAMFVYLSDVLTDDDGPHDLEGPDGVRRTIYGPAGTVFLADTSRMHRGRKPTQGERGILWFRWGISDRPPANEWDKIQPVAAARLGDRYPTDPRLRESIQLIAA